MGLFNRTKEVPAVIQPPCRHELLEAAEYLLSEQSASKQNETKLRLTGLRRCRLCRVWLAPDGKIVPENRLAELLETCGDLLPWDGDGQIIWGASPMPLPGPEKGPGELVAMASSPRYHLDEVVLAATTRQHLDEALVKLQFSDLIYREWGFAKVDPLGNGASFNFYGPSGTGKTRTAEALAGSLNLPFLCVLPGTLENKYMGETPKNIQRIFAKAKEEGALLFFDEAESLFGRRASDVTQGIDHEVNVTKSMLLAEMERFDGVMVIATNFQENYDAAFRRRIQFHIQFPLPDRLALEGLMAQFLVANIPLGDPRQDLLQAAVNYCDALEGDLRMSGGDLVSALRISLSKAVLAGPDENRRLRTEHVLTALQEVQENKQQVGRRPSAPKPFDPSKSTQILTDLYNRRPEPNP